MFPHFTLAYFMNHLLIENIAIWKIKIKPQEEMLPTVLR
jgi:hypothetical protein